MKKLPAVAAAALIVLGALSSTAAEARGRGGLAIGLLGGLAAGALVGAAVSEAHAAPAYGYGYPPPAYGYDEAGPEVAYRPRRFVRAYDERASEEDVPVYATRRVYDERPVAYAPAGYGWRPHCDRPYRHGGW